MSGLRVVAVPGGTALLRDLSELRIRDRRRIEATSVELLQVLGPEAAAKMGDFDPTRMGLGEMAQLGIGGSSMEQIGRVQDATILAYLVDWDLKDEQGEKLPLPNADTIGDLQAGVYDALSEATAELGQGRVDFSPPDPSSSGFEASPTEPSGDSDQRSGAELESESTETSSPSGGSMSSGVPSPV